MKFGGTSVQDAARIANVARIALGRLSERPVVVTSAMGGVTNELVRTIDCARRGDRAGLDAATLALRERHLQATEALGPAAETARERLEWRLRELRVLLRGVRLTGQATPRASDAVLGYGELLAQELVAAAIVAAGGLGVAVDAREVLVTDDRFGAARADLRATTVRTGLRILPLLQQGVIPVVGGYVGATPDGIPTTLGRGGSDLSASLFGLALGATTIEIWTDVDGLMSADPRQVTTARWLSRTTFLEAAELAGFGAKVLHPASIDPAVKAGIPVVVRNSLAAQHPGTRIDAAGADDAPVVRAVVSRSDLALVSLLAPSVMREPAVLSRLLALSLPVEVTPLGVLIGPVGVDLLLSRHQAADAVRRLRSEGSVESIEPLASIAVIGERVAQSPAIWSAVVAAAARFGPLRVMHGARGAALQLVLPEDRLGEAVDVLHTQFVTDLPALRTLQGRP